MGEKTLFQEKDCLQIGDDISLQGKVIILHPAVLPKNCQDAGNQIYYCRGVNGSCFNTVSLRDGREVSWNRSDILGIAKPEILSDQYLLQLSKIHPAGALDVKKHEPQYSGYCFLPDGLHYSGTWLCDIYEVENYIDMQKDYQHRIMICDRNDFCVFEMVEGEILFPTKEMIDAQNSSHEKEDVELKL